MKLEKRKQISNQTINISGSKSISNRLLILRELFGLNNIENLSNSQDTKLLADALQSDSEIIDIHHAGTAMRFLTSYFASAEGKKVIITGSSRMKERPIKPLVDALRELGAEIHYLESDGFPPLKIYGKKLCGGEVNISAGVSSQFITSLMLIGAKLEHGLQINIEGEITSLSYLEMTFKLLRNFGIECTFEENVIRILPFAKNLNPLNYITVESDWSSASYFYSLAAIGRESINMKCFRPYSLQGDSAIKEFYWNYFGVNTISDAAEDLISLFPESNFEYPDYISLDMNNCPDIAQTLCVTATALKIPFEITGLQTLKVKETDRLVALKNELFKIGCITETTENSIKSMKFFEPNENIQIKTYSDHRMAMSFAPFSLFKEINIENEDVVEKSYPDFWTDFENATEIESIQNSSKS